MLYEKLNFKKWKKEEEREKQESGRSHLGDKI